MSDTKRFNPSTWADGFGVWHAFVPYTVPNPKDAARQASQMIRDEINARQGHQVKRVRVEQDGFNGRGRYYREVSAS